MRETTVWTIEPLWIKTRLITIFSNKRFFCAHTRKYFQCICVIVIETYSVLSRAHTNVFDEEYSGWTNSRRVKSLWRKWFMNMWDSFWFSVISTCTQVYSCRKVYRIVWFWVRWILQPSYKINDFKASTVYLHFYCCKGQCFN